MGARKRGARPTFTHHMGNRWSCIGRRSTARLRHDMEDAVDLDGGPERQVRKADRRASVAAGIAEHLDHQVAGAIHHLGLLAEAGQAVHVAREPHRSLDTIERAEVLVCSGENGVTRQPGSALASLDVDGVAESSGHSSKPVRPGDRPGDEEQLTDLRRDS